MSLIKRFDEAEGPSRELDGDIAFACGLCPDGPGWWRVKQKPWQWKHVSHDAIDPPWEAPRFTASLDATKTLVPEDCGWMVESYGAASIHRLVKNEESAGYPIIAEAGVYEPLATPELAFVAAVLRARGIE